MKYQNIREEELKNRVAKDYFWLYDCTKIIGNVDFCVSMLQSQTGIFEQESLLWAEAKSGSSDIYKSIVQLILTIGKARTFDKFLPPAMLGALDGEKIAFIPYSDIAEIFYINDFNWNVAPSNYETKEFKIVYDKVKQILDTGTLIFNFERDDKDLSKFIRLNFLESKRGISKIKIDKNNFIIVYNKWLIEVKPSIQLNWESVKKSGLIEGDFYLADLLSQENITLKDKLYVLLQSNHYELNRKLEDTGLFTSSTATFNDNQKAHNQFWNKYERPPKEEYWDYIVNRRDLLVPQDIRERKGSFFTPQIWVELSQKYLADTLGENWQDEYYIWDCAAGTGNLLTGLTNNYRIWASTLDQQDVEVMHDRIRNGANLLDDHVFQFDFLNDDFSKLPKSLLEVLNNEKKRNKLIIYINPPYAEATSSKTVSGTGENKAGVAIDNKSYEHFKNRIGNATNELFALFMAQIYEKYPNTILAQFSKMKFIQGTNFKLFKDFFLAKYENGFIVPANTFDNVKGKFPIGFTIWDLKNKSKIENIKCDIYNKEANYLGKKIFFGVLPESINKWIKFFDDKKALSLCFIDNPAPDFQNNKFLNISNFKGTRHVNYIAITSFNLLAVCVYFSVRHCIEPDWINDRDQFLYPNNKWQKDNDFQNDCLAFAIFHGQNRISTFEGINHLIPFTEYEVAARDNFDSNFLSDYIKGKESETSNFIISEPIELYGNKKKKLLPLEFSPEAKAVFDSGRKLWQYYHKQPKVNVNASLYDIREYFQGRNEKGKMNNKSKDEHYNLLIADLRNNLKLLAKKIEPKVYEYNFLKA